MHKTLRPGRDGPRNARDGTGTQIRRQSLQVVGFRSDLGYPGSRGTLQLRWMHNFSSAGRMLRGKFCGNSISRFDGIVKFRFSYWRMVLWWFLVPVMTWDQIFAKFGHWKISIPAQPFEFTHIYVKERGKLGQSISAIWFDIGWCLFVEIRSEELNQVGTVISRVWSGPGGKKIVHFNIESRLDWFTREVLSWPRSGRH